MTDTPQLVGADLARMALANARLAAKTAPTTTPRRKPKRTTRPGGRREPVTLADAIATLGADLPLKAGVAGGSIIDQWPTLCPQYDGLVQPVAYDETCGRLDLRPSTHAYAAQLRLLGGQLAKQINDKLGRPTVRTIRVLPVGPVDTPTRPAAATGQPEPDAPVKTRATASPGYRHALKAALTHKGTPQTVDPNILEAITRQETALRAHRENVAQFADGVAETERVTGPVLDRSEAVRRAALARKRAEAAGTVEPRRVFDVA
jgi:hypothetical protein